MAGKPGRSGKNRHKYDAWRVALRVVALRRVGRNGPRRIDLLAQRLFALGLAGNLAAIKEIGDRLDGRPAQQRNDMGDDDDGPVSLVVRWVTPGRAAGE